MALEDLTSDEQPAQLDDLDRQLIRLLRENGRATNRELARVTGVSQVTIANRIRRLISDNIIRIQAVANPARLGFPVEVIVGIHVEVNQIQAAAVALADLPEVRYVTITSGAYDILIAVLLHSNADLVRFLTVTLAGIPGIRQVETAHALQVLKRNPDWIFFSEQ